MLSLFSPLCISLFICFHILFHFLLPYFFIAFDRINYNIIILCFEWKIGKFENVWIQIFKHKILIMVSKKEKWLWLEKIKNYYGTVIPKRGEKGNLGEPQSDFPLKMDNYIRKGEELSLEIRIIKLLARTSNCLVRMVMPNFKISLDGFIFRFIRCSLIWGFQNGLTFGILTSGFWFYLPRKMGLFWKGLAVVFAVWQKMALKSSFWESKSSKIYL